MLTHPVAWLAVLVVVVLVGLALAVRVVRQYERGVVPKFGRVIGEEQPGQRLLAPISDVMHRVSLRVVARPIQSQGIITRDIVFPAPLMSTIGELG